MTLHVGLVVGGWLMAAVWVGKLVEVARGMARVPNLLEPRYDAWPDGMPEVVVIVPARNEAAGVGACLRSLLGQDYGRMRVIAVDDRSTDRTGAVMEALVAESGGRLEVIGIRELPAGWLGKTHAMAMAARVAREGKRPEYLLFTDGDVLFREDAVRRAVAYAEMERADHFVLLPTTLVKTPGEGMLLGYLQVMGMWAVRPWKVGDARARRDAIGVGAFNMIRASVYEALGGFDARPMEIVEDLDLGRRVKRVGYRQRAAVGPGMVEVHWAEGAWGIVTGMTKNIFAVFRFRSLWLVGAALGMAVISMGPVALLWIDGGRLAAVLAMGAIAGLYGVSGRTSRISGWYALGFPVAAAAVVFSMLRSMGVTLRQGGVTWRGTFYPLAELRKLNGPGC